MPFRLLALRDFREWWLGFVAAELADSMRTFGVGWLVIELARGRGAGTAAPYLGMMGLAQPVPSLTLSAFGGVAGDRQVQNFLADGGTSSGTFVIVTIGGALGITTALGAAGGALALLCLGLALAVPVFARTRRVTAPAAQADAE